MGRRADQRNSFSRFSFGLAALCAFLAAACGGTDPPGDRTPHPVSLDWPPGELRAGGGVEAALDRGESHVYRVPLEAGSLFRVRVEQDGVDVELVWKGPEGSVALTADRITAQYGPELVLTVTERSGVHALEVRAFPGFGPGHYRAEIEALRPAATEDRRAADAYRRFREAEAYAYESRERAAEVWAEALATWRELEERGLEAQVLRRMAQDHHDSGEWGASAERYREALAVFQAIGARRGELMVRHDLAAPLIRLARYDEAIVHYRAALELARAFGDAPMEASIDYGLGKAYREQGELQRALDRYEAALEHLPKTDFDTRPLALHALGALYRLHFQDPERARELLLEAHDLYRPEEVPTHAAYRARSLRQLALLAQEGGRPDEARGHLAEALAVRGAFDRCGRASLLASLALLEEESGRSGLSEARADARMVEAFDTLAAGSCLAAETAIEQVVGELAEGRGRPDEALRSYRRAAERAAEIGDRERLADALAGVARAERARGRLAEALDASARVLTIVEEIRPTVLREDLRTAFFANAQDRYDLHIALASELGRHEEAWATAERARAQGLRDLLTEAGTRLRRGADPNLVARERTLRHRINLLENRRLAAADNEGIRSREIDDLVAEIERVRGEIRRASPAFDAVAGREAPSLAGVRRELLADDGAETLILEYRLGEERSWLWAIGTDVLEAVALPPRAEIERQARIARGWAGSLQWPGHPPPPLCELSRTVLGPVAPLLGDRRLVLIPDGALESVPFAVLPDPRAFDPGAGSCPAAPLLVDRHEIVHLPSVGTLAAQRRLRAHRAPARGWLAMVADPVYGPNDERLERTTIARARSAGRTFERLPHAGEEAAAILGGLPDARTLVATGPAASKATVTGGSLAGYRIVHFATHGVLHPEQPLLSFLALSEWTADGAPVARAERTLYAHEIYDLELPAELVVLSACETALGRPTRGEGLVSGLPRAFLYAGAERVLVSLWPVPDRGTRDLMERFYRGLVDRGLPPGRALQEAQRSLRRDGRPPHQWAGFVLQGDWRPLP